MPVTDITTDPENLTMTLVADAAAPVARLWEAFTTRASWSASGALPAGPPPSPRSTCAPADASTTA
jgi:hypothetical protein